MASILSNLNRFFFLAERFLGKVVVKATLKIPPHLATLPCETLMPAQQAINNTYKVHTHTHTPV